MKFFCSYYTSILVNSSYVHDNYSRNCINRKFIHRDDTSRIFTCWRNNIVITLQSKVILNRFIIAINNRDFALKLGSRFMNLISNVRRNEKLRNRNLRFQNQNRTIAYFFHSNADLRRQMALMLSHASNYNIGCILISSTSPRYNLVIMEDRCLRATIQTIYNKCIPFIDSIFIIYINVAKCTSQPNIVTCKVKCS